MTSLDPTTAAHTDGPGIDSPELIADPAGEFDRMRESAPLVAGHYLDGRPIWYVTREAQVRELLSDPRFVTSPAQLPGGDQTSARERLLRSFGVPDDLIQYLVGNILDADGPDHVRLRKLVSRAFTVRRVNALRSSVERIAAGLLDELAAEAADPTELVERFCYPLPITVICDLVGIPLADRPSWRVWGRDLTARRPERFGPVLREVVDHLHQLIEHRRAAPADDLLSELIRTHDEDGDRLSDREMVSLVLTLVFAGHETTAHLLSNSIVALLTHPDQLALLRADPGLWPAAVHELLRWGSPVLIAALRYASEEMEWAGGHLHVGDAMQPVLLAANRDPRQRAEPERLDIMRRPSGHGEAHVAFGYGVHYCLGAALARQEAEVGLRALFHRFPNLALAGDPAELKWMPAPGIRRLT
ncbi:MAG TPA: cytochrome P450, partial [Pseudonocardia sp.]